MSVALIVLAKNEEEWIRAFLDYHVPYFDEVVIVDDMSTDRTHEIIDEFIAANPNGPEVKYFQRALGKSWCEQQTFAHAQMTCDWGFHVDVDEILQLKLLVKLRFLIDKLNNEKKYGMALPTINIIDRRQIDVYPDYHIRLVKAGIKWEGDIHPSPMIPESENNPAPIAIIEVDLLHIKTEERQQRANKFYSTFEGQPKG